MSPAFPSAKMSASSSTHQPLLTIAIPTWNRAKYLAENLQQLHSELNGVEKGTVEVLVSDNCSPDATPAVVAAAQANGLEIHSIRNEQNLGWTRNFIQCFEKARGKYVLLLGDDDLFIDGALGLLLNRLSTEDYGAVVLRPYGYDHDFRAEYPGGTGKEVLFEGSHGFLVATSRCFTLTSACVFNKSLLGGVDSKQFITTDLATFHLFLRAVLAGNKNLLFDRYLIASKRQNSASYEYAEIFVKQLWRIIESHRPFGLQGETIRTIERDKLLSYYPFYLFDQRLSGRGDLRLTRQIFRERFSQRALYRWWLEPIIMLPRPLALAWGAIATVVGRIAGGELRRGLKFAWNRLRRARTRPAPAKA